MSAELKIIDNIKKKHSLFENIFKYFTSASASVNKSPDVGQFLAAFDIVNAQIRQYLKQTYPSQIIVTRSTSPYEYVCVSNCKYTTPLFKTAVGTVLTFNQLLFTAHDDCFTPSHFLNKGPGVNYRIVIPQQCYDQIIPLYLIEGLQDSFIHYKELIIHPSSQFTVLHADMETCAIHHYKYTPNQPDLTFINSEQFLKYTITLELLPHPEPTAIKLYISDQNGIIVPFGTYTVPNIILTMTVKTLNELIIARTSKDYLGPFDPIQFDLYIYENDTYKRWGMFITSDRFKRYDDIIQTTQGSKSISSCIFPFTSI
jgi:hypothetical protein